MNKKIFLTVAAISIIGIGLLTSTTIFAQDAVNGQNPMSSLVAKIADKFGLKKEDVQAVFDTDRQERQQEMQTKYEEQLSQDVTDKKITEAQKQLIIAKNKELETNRQAKMESTKNMTDDERKTAMEKERTELESWAKTNGIDLKYLMGGMGMGGHGGPGGPGGPKPEGENVPPATPTATSQ
jgi:hypothetical protein